MSFAKDCATSRRDPQVLSTFEQAGGLYGSDLSYVSGTSSRPLLGMTIGEAFDAAAGNGVRRRRWSFVIRTFAGHTPNSLRRWIVSRLDFCPMGCEPGDRVGIWSPNRAEWVVAQFATAKAGLILVNINPAYRPAELAYVLRKVNAAH